MKHFTFLFFSLISLSSFAQNWLKPGAEWHYSSDGEALQLFHHLKLESDTVLFGIPCQRVYHKTYAYQSTGPGTYQLFNYASINKYYALSNDTLFRLFPASDTLTEISIIFRDQAEWQSLSTIRDTNCSQSIVLKSHFHSTETINGFSHDIYSITVTDGQTQETIDLGFFSSRFGSYNGVLSPEENDCLMFSLPWGLSIDFNFICYQDDEGFFIKDTPNECDYYLTLNTDELSRNNISIYPNPAKSKITIQSEIALDEVSLYDLQGKKLPIQLDINLKKIDVSDFKPGIYLLEITSGQMKRTEKLMIE